METLRWIIIIEKLLVDTWSNKTYGLTTIKLPQQIPVISESLPDKVKTSLTSVPLLVRFNEPEVKQESHMQSLSATVIWLQRNMAFEVRNPSPSSDGKSSCAGTLPHRPLVIGICGTRFSPSLRPLQRFWN